jgi:hypothetical protein
MMRTPVLVLSAALLVALVAVCAVAQSTVIPSSNQPPAPVQQPVLNPSGWPVAPPAPAPKRTLDQVYDEIETVRAQKAELDKKEQELVKEARQMLDKQTERGKNLGVVPPPPVTLPAPGPGPERIDLPRSTPAEPLPTVPQRP